MPLVGTDFTPEQRQALRAMADTVQPGLTDLQVLAWATEQGVQGAMRSAFDLFAKKITDQTNDQRRRAIDPIKQVIDSGNEPE
jgi:hypothetical protein